MNVKNDLRLLVRPVLLVAWLASADAVADQQQPGGLTARHRAGQTLLVWREVDPPVTRDSIAAVELIKLRRDLDEQKKVRYRIYRSGRPIGSVEGLSPIAEVPPLSCFNTDYYGISPKPQQPALRYVVRQGEPPVPPGTGIYAHNPSRAGNAYYAVTLVVDGKENTSVGESNTTGGPVDETVGQGVPVLQRVARPESFSYVKDPTLYYYVRWESPPNCAAEGRPYDYLVAVPPAAGDAVPPAARVAVPPNVPRPVPVGIHLHCWGGSLNGGYGWWYGAEKSHILIASNQIPYDWWTGYHELYWKAAPEKESWQKGVVRPYSQTRMFSFLDWVATKWNVDLTRTHVAGNSMGGSGSPMLAIRFPERIAWGVSWVGIHNPARSPHFKGSYERVYGKHEWDVRFEDGHSVWDHFNDAWYLRRHPEKEIGLISFSNGKNDGAIGWAQAVEFYRALQDTRRPHVFVWGQSGHGQRASLPISLSDRRMPMDLRTDQSLPAFSGCSLDDDPGDGDPKRGDPKGQVNLYLHWQTGDVVDRDDSWEMTVGLIDKAPEDRCTVDITPRRLQRFSPKPGQQVMWTNTSPGENKPIQAGRATADEHGLIQLEGVRVSKRGNRIRLSR